MILKLRPFSQPHLRCFRAYSRFQLCPTFCYSTTNDQTVQFVNWCIVASNVVKATNSTCPLSDQGASYDAAAMLCRCRLSNRWFQAHTYPVPGVLFKWSLKKTMQGARSTPTLFQSKSLFVGWQSSSSVIQRSSIFSQVRAALPLITTNSNLLDQRRLATIRVRNGKGLGGRAQFHNKSRACRKAIKHACHVTLGVARETWKPATETQNSQVGLKAD